MADGLTSAEARRRLAEFGENRIRSQRRTGPLVVFIGQFKSPIILIVIGAAIVSLFLQDHTDAILILAIVLASGVLGFWQEYAATDAVAKLRALVETKTRVMRDGAEAIILLADVVPRDVTLLSAGAVILGDVCSKPRELCVKTVEHSFCRDAACSASFIDAESAKRVFYRKPTDA